MERSRSCPARRRPPGPSPRRRWLRGARTSRSSRGAGGVTPETWSVQQTPDGNAFSVVWFESPDPEKAIAELARDPSEFGIWSRERVKEINGIELDPAQPLPGAPEVTFDWRA